MSYRTPPVILSLFSVIFTINALTAEAQTIRVASPVVEVLGEGAEPLERIAWAIDPESTSTIQIRSRMIDGYSKVIDIPPGRASVVRMYTLQGMFLRSKPITTAVWRIQDATARLKDPEADAIAKAKKIKEQLENDDKNEPKVSEEEPAASPLQVNPRDINELVGRGNGKSRVGLPSQSADPRLVELLQRSLRTLNGGVIKQKVEPAGIIPSGSAPTIENITKRTYGEAMNLSYLIGIGEVTLPETPIGIGASWSTEMHNTIGGMSAKTSISWTLLDRTGDTLRLAISYQRRGIYERDIEPNRIRASRVNCDGRGEVHVNLSNPLALKAQVVQVPAESPENGKALPQITWISMDSLKAPGANPELGPARETTTP